MKVRKRYWQNYRSKIKGPWHVKVGPTVKWWAFSRSQCIIWTRGGHYIQKNFRSKKFSHRSSRGQWQYMSSHDLTCPHMTSHDGSWMNHSFHDLQNWPNVICKFRLLLLNTSDYSASLVPFTIENECLCLKRQQKLSCFLILTSADSDL